ncbi:18.1 kDa class I heat shock protein-like [Bidens hawaiensis]|uniref:18.1 kDa class I heat shock protein-like n=1 Tax=Bidens hawaiensis TaxID=980011 RepID=UPI00404A8718
MANVQGRSPFDNKPSSSSLVFEEFVPPAAWTEDSTGHYLLVGLPDFKRQELKLQVDNKTHLIVSGERQVRENKYKRFAQRFRLPKNADTENITGKLDGEILYISVPKKVEHEHQEMKHDNIPSPAPVTDENGSDNKDGEKNQKEKHGMYIDEKWRQEAGLYLKLAMEKLKNNKGIVVIAIFAFSLGVLVTQKVQSNEN